ncbi:MAG: hypothetical protein OES47_14530 [Acidobacteriota bacterium]|nr:hypothetical protein [Acidobacteriota bacterium]
MSRTATFLFRVALGLALVAVSISVPAPAVAQGSIVFNQVPEPVGSAVFVRGTGATKADGLLVLELWAKDVTDLYGVTFAFRYPKKLFKFPAGLADVVTEGTFLSENGVEPTNLVVKKTSEGVLEVGFSRLGQVPGVTGTGHLFTLKLRGLGVSGSKKIRYRRARAVSSTVQVFEDVVFRAGKIVVQAAQEDPYAS